jgi:hypothetical protein
MVENRKIRMALLTTKVIGFDMDRKDSRAMTIPTGKALKKLGWRRRRNTDGSRYYIPPDDWMAMPVIGQGGIKKELASGVAS